MPSPMPDAPPVMKTVLLEKDFMSIYLAGLCKFNLHVLSKAK
jgi:hypothetical protein